MQGFNMGRYVPPDLEGTTSGNKLHNKKPPGIRITASRQREQTVRFEMPFAVWCGTCPKPTIIGQGVRFNAVKTRAGSYHSTPIWSFRLKHVACGGEIEIRTDPQNTTYVVTAGGRRRDTGTEDGGDGRIEILTDKEREELRANAFKKLERTIEDREMAEHARQRIEELEDAQAVGWDDPYAANARLRREFRAGRHQREKDGRATEALQDRMSLGIDLLPENAADAKRAALVDFRPADESKEERAGNKALAKPLFATSSSTLASESSSTANTTGKHQLTTSAAGGKQRTDKKRRLKSEIAASQMRENLVSEIVGSTRAAHDPFLVSDKTKQTTRIVGIKRKKPEGEMEASETKTARPKESPAEAVAAAPSAALVEYDSD